jgi:HSP20 family protein
MLPSTFATDIRQTLEQFRRAFDQMFEGFYGYSTPRVSTTGAETREWVFSPVLESAWTDSHLHLRAVLPGVSQNDVKVSVQNNQLVIEGERKLPEGFDRNSVTQLPYGKFYTAVTLPGNLDQDKISCRLHDGVLDIRIPITEAAKPRQIQIETGETRKSIEA